MAKNTIEKFLKNKSKMSKLRRTITCLAAVVVFATTYALILPAMTLDGSDAQKTPGIDTKTEINVEKFGQSLGGDQDSGSDVADNAAQAVNSEEKDVSGGEGALQSEGNGEKSTEAALNSEGEKASGSDSKVGSDNKVNDVKDGAKKDNAGSKDSKTADDNKDKKGGSKDLSLITEKTEIKFDGKGYKVIAEVGADAKLPADTKLKVREIKKDTKDENGVKYAYDTYCDEALKAVRNVDGKEAKGETREVMLYDISFDSASADKAIADDVKNIPFALDKDNNLEPSSKVKVKIVFDEAMDTNDKGSARAVHFDKRLENMNDEEIANVKKDVLETKTEGDKKEEMKEASFKSDKFSVYGLVYTIKTGGEEKAEEQKATAGNENVLTASDDKYEITVTYDDKAGIPEGAELKVREITEKDEEYANLQEDIAKNLDEKDLTIPKKPALFDISIWADSQEIEPAEGSDIKVEIKLAKDSVSGMFTDKDAPLLVNDDPIDKEMSDLDNSIQVIHQVEEGKLEVMKTEDKFSKKSVKSSFETDSFSNWLVFLDQDVETINIGIGDTITLRPYGQWVWNQQNSVDGQYVAWVEPTYQNTNGIVYIEKPHYNDGQLNQEYDFYHLIAANTGEFDLQTTAGKTIHVVIGNQPTAAVPSTVSGLDNIKVNIFNYDLDKSLDVPENTASGMDVGYGQWPNQYATDGINAASALKFLGWGASDGNNRINNYVATSPTTNIVQSTLSAATDGKKYPRLNGNGDTSLQYLFSSGNSDVEAHMNVGGLFRQDKDGYYYFNSNTNYARYNEITNSFILYEHTYTQSTTRNNTDNQHENSKPIGFFPFHDYDSTDHLSPNHDKNLDHHFGLSMEVKFSLPEGKVLKKADGSTEPIKFEFSGDDDMWVFVDDNLSLDLGGIHQPITGSIDFTNDNRFEAGKEYTLRVFYLERGGCDSNCSIKFNMPLSLGTGDVRIAKAKEGGEEIDTTYLGGAKFGIWENGDCSGEPIKTMTSASGTGLAVVENLPVREAGQVYYMKEISAPNGYIKSDKIYTLKASQSAGEDGKFTFTIREKDNQEKALETITQEPYSNATVIHNKENKPISLKVEKKWQDQNGNPVEPSNDYSATFKVYRLRSYKTQAEVVTGSENTLRIRHVVNDPPNGGFWQTSGEKAYKYLRGKKVTINYDYHGQTSNGEKRQYRYSTNNGSNWSYVNLSNKGSFDVTIPSSGQYLIEFYDANNVVTWTIDDGATEGRTVVDEPDENYNGPTITLTNGETEGTFNSGLYSGTANAGKFPVQETINDIEYTYKYYIQETERTPSDSERVYVDGNNNVVSNPATLASNENGAKQAIVNKLPNGSLKLRKWVTISGLSPDDEPDLRTKADGEYIFAISGIAETTTEGISKTVKIKIENGQATKAWIDNEETTLDSDGYVEVPNLIPGDYTITEGECGTDIWLSSITGGKDDGDVDSRSITVTVAADKNGSAVVERGKATFTNNYTPDDEEDVAHVSIKKTFEGLPKDAVLDDDFKITITIKGTTYELTSNPTNPAVTFDGSQFPVCSWTISVKGMLKDEQVHINETNAGYPSYDVTTSINGQENTTSYNGTVSSGTVIDAFSPKIYEPNNKKDFNVTDTKIFMALLTDDHVLVISKNRLSLSERAAIEDMLPTMSEGNWGKKLPPYYFTADENRPFHFKGSTITYSNNTVHFDKKCQWTKTAEVEITYKPGKPADFNFVNTYSEKSADLEITKVDADGMTTPLAGAKFEIRKVDPKNGSYVGDDVILPTTTGADNKTGNDGKATFTGLTEGYYEVKETVLPAGYIQTGEGKFYIRVHNGVLTMVERDSNAEGGWKEKSNEDTLQFTAASGNSSASVKVGNEKGAALPSAGGPGTTWIYILGTLLMISSGMSFVVRRRMRA